jgi:DNA-binding MarR family transcriptional regulator
MRTRLVEAPMTSFPPKTVSRPELLVDGSDAAFRTLVDDLSHFASRLQQIRDGLARRMGVTTPQYSILMALARGPGEGAMGVKDLAERLRISVPFVVNETKKLERHGLIAKLPVAADKRKVDIVLTDEGQRAIALVGSFQRDVNDALFSCLDEASFHELAKLTRELLTSSGEALTLSEAQSAPAATPKSGLAGST